MTGPDLTPLRAWDCERDGYTFSFLEARDPQGEVHRAWACRDAAGEIKGQGTGLAVGVVLDLVEEREKWVQAFQDYGDHAPGCGVSKWNLLSVFCDCGLKEALLEADDLMAGGCRVAEGGRP
jgi:hypothetical protein